MKRRCVLSELLFNCGALVAEPERKLKIRIPGCGNFRIKVDVPVVCEFN